MSFTRNEKIAGGLLLLAAIGLTAVAMKKPSPAEKRSNLKKMVSETAGEDKAAAVDKMTDEEVNTVTDTITPSNERVAETSSDSGSGSGDGGGGGGGSSSPSANTPPAPGSPTLQPGYVLPVPSLSPGTPSLIPTLSVSQTPAQIRALVAHRPRLATMIVSHRATPVHRTTIIKRGIGAVDGTDCVAILKKYGIM